MQMMQNFEVILRHKLARVLHVPHHTRACRSSWLATRDRHAALP